MLLTCNCFWRHSISVTWRVKASLRVGVRRIRFASGVSVCEWAGNWGKIARTYREEQHFWSSELLPSSLRSLLWATQVQIGVRSEQSASNKEHFDACQTERLMDHPPMFRCLAFRRVVLPMIDQRKNLDTSSECHQMKEENERRRKKEEWADGLLFSHYLHL